MQDVAESFIGMALLEPLDGNDVGIHVNVEIDDLTSPTWHGVVVKTEPVAEVPPNDITVVLDEGARRGYRSTAATRAGVVRTQIVLNGNGPFKPSAAPDIGAAGDVVTDELVAEVMRYYAFTENYARFHIAHVRGEFEAEAEAAEAAELAEAERDEPIVELDQPAR